MPKSALDALQRAQPPVEASEDVRGDRGEHETDHEAEDRVLSRLRRQHLGVPRLCRVYLLSSGDVELRFELIDLRVQVRDLQNAAEVLRGRDRAFRGRAVCFRGARFRLDLRDARCFEFEQLSTRNFYRREDRALARRALPSDVGAGDGVGEQCCCFGFVRFHRNSYELAFFRARLDANLALCRCEIVFAAQVLANSFDDDRVDDGGLISDAGSGHFPSFAGELFFRARAQIDLRRHLKDRRSAFVIEVSSGGDENRHGEDQPLALPERSKDGCSVGGLVHGKALTAEEKHHKEGLNQRLKRIVPISRQGKRACRACNPLGRETDGLTPQISVGPSGPQPFACGERVARDVPRRASSIVVAADMWMCLAFASVGAATDTVGQS